MIKKTLLKGISAAMLLTLGMSMTACGKKEEKNKENFTVGFDAAFPPYGYMDEEGEYVGFDLDLAAEVCERRDWKLVKQPIDWDSKDFELESGNIDCIWNGFTMNGRMDDYTWSEAYVDNTQVFVVRKDSGISSFEDLEGKIVTVQTASSALDALNSDDCKELTESFKKLEEIPDYNQAFMNLEAGAVQAIAMDVGVAKYQLEQRGNDYVMLEEPIITEQYGVGFYKGNEELRDQVQETLDEMEADGTLAKIAEKWGLSDSIILGE